MTINDAIEMMPNGWTLISFNHNGAVVYKKGSARLTRNANGSWDCEVNTTAILATNQLPEKTPEAAIADVQEQITTRIAQLAKLLTDVTGVEV